MYSGQDQMIAIVQMTFNDHVYVWELLYFAWNAIAICAKWPNQQYIIIACKKVFTLNWHQANTTIDL